MATIPCFLPLRHSGRRKSELGIPRPVSGIVSGIIADLVLIYCTAAANADPPAKTSRCRLWKASDCRELRMDGAVSLVAIVAAILLGAMSPGPSFVLIVRTAMAGTRKSAMAAALGMGIGGAVFATAAVLGLHVVLTTVPTLYVALKVAGAAYLLYLAIMLWRGARRPLPVESAGAESRNGWWRSFAVGLATQLSNPKTAVVYASIFTAFLSADRSAWLASALVPCIFVVEFGWYAIVAIAFSSEVPRQGYLRAKPWIDRAAGTVMGFLAVKLAADAR